MFHFDTQNSEDFVKSVMNQTVGNPCVDAQERLNERFESKDQFSEIDNEILENHLSHCHDCRLLADRLPGVISALQQAVLWSPDSDFADSVIESTRKLPLARYRSIKEKTFDFTNRILLTRPRFALEAAYILTLFLFLTFHVTGIPVTRAAHSFTRSSESIHQVSRTVNQSITGLGSELKNSLEHSKESLQLTSQSLFSHGRAAIEHHWKNIKSSLKQFTTYLLSKSSNLLGRIIHQSEDNHEQAD